MNQFKKTIQKNEKELKQNQKSNKFMDSVQKKYFPINKPLYT